jgi:hypothetical protein
MSVFLLPIGLYSEINSMM